MGGEFNRPSYDKASDYPVHNFTPRGPLIERIALDRLRGLTSDGQFKDINLKASMIIEEGKGEVKLSVYSPPDLERPLFKDVVGKKEFKECKKGDVFGPSWSTHWFKVEIKVPTHYFKDYERVQFEWDTGSEGLIYTTDGLPLQGLTGGWGGDRRVEYLIPSDWSDDKFHTIYVEASMNGMFGCGAGDTIAPPDNNRYFGLDRADIVVPNMDAQRLFWDFWVIGDCARELPSEGWEKHKALTVGTQIVNAFKRNDKESILAARKIAQEFIGKNVDSVKVYDSKKEVQVYGIGHCHIDTAWLWPFDETRRKAARSWATQVDLMNRYPEHRFACSQAQQFKWLQNDYPSLFDAVKAKVKSGQFLPIGGTWVEMDTNMPSGEALCRQFLYGQRYFESRFGKRCETFWLPDTFGYSAQMPQLSRLAGMKYFFTQKLSWNNINSFPHTTFSWVALDGTQVLTHMTPCETYTAQAHVGDLIRSNTQHKSKGVDKSSLIVFGNGDGGGGPLATMLEKLRRCRGISDTTGGLARVEMGHTVDEFYEQLEKNTDGGKTLSNWYGELYFELHRGTYTSQAHTKRSNRYSEILMHEIEHYSTLASLKDSKFEYPKEKIDKLWEIILLCQFHDVLPGSSIEMVYDDARTLYAEVAHIGDELLQNAFKALSLRKCDIDITKNNTKNLLALNSLSWGREGLFDTSPYSITSKGAESKMYSKEQKAFVQSKTAGTAILSESKDCARVSEIKKDVFVLENASIKATFDGGLLTSLYDIKNNREIIPEGAKGNQLVLFEDQPLYWDAWDVEIYHLQQPTYLTGGKVTILESGPQQASILVENQISSQSWIKTKISLDGKSPNPIASSNPLNLLTFTCESEWHENRKFLKVEFPVNIHAETATYECQYGIIKRPTHYNTSWDAAKFEVTCHKWADLSEYGYGVTVLNDSKYGFATQGNVMRLSLLRSPKAPDAHADMSRHFFRYGLQPHLGTASEANIVRSGYEFNYPIHIVEYTGKPNDSSAVQDALSAIDFDGKSNVFLDCMKRGEDDEDVAYEGSSVKKGRSVILRLYEAYGGRGAATIKTKFNVKSVFKTNILEDEIEEIKLQIVKSESGAAFDIKTRPFEVVTLKLVL